MPKYPDFFRVDVARGKKSFNRDPNALLYYPRGNTPVGQKSKLENCVTSMLGVTTLVRRTFEDCRGQLHAFEAFDNLPFAPQRFFLIEVEAGGGERGGHANSCAEVIVVLRGGVTVELENGQECSSVRLLAGDAPLWISAGVVIRRREFEKASLLLVCAPDRYATTCHFSEPQVHLVLEGPAT